MKLPESEREFNRAAFRAMSIPEKADYIFAYYKLPLVLILIALIAIGSAIHQIVTHKDAVLYAAYLNVVPDEETDSTLTGGYLERIGAGASAPIPHATRCSATTSCTSPPTTPSRTTSTPMPRSSSSWAPSTASSSTW